MKKLRAAIIGYGRSGRDIHTKLLQLMPEQFEIAAIVDKSAMRREMIAKETTAEPLETVDALYGRDDIDFVVNASFSHEHQPLSIALLKKGFSVLSEKPAAKDAVSFSALLNVAEEMGKPYQVFQQYRFAPSYLKVKEIIASGVLGRIVQVKLNYSGFSRRWDWQTVQGFAAGSLLNTGPHPVDQALDLMGFPEEVETTAIFDRAQTSGDAEDYAKLLLYAPGAPVLDIEISACNAFPADTYQVQGTTGTLQGTTSHLAWKCYKPQDEEPRPVIMEPLAGEHGEPIYCREKLHIEEGSWDATGPELDEFTAKGIVFYQEYYKMLTEGMPMTVTNDQVLAQMRVMESAHKQNDARVAAFIEV